MANSNTTDPTSNNDNEMRDTREFNRHHTELSQ